MRAKISGRSVRFALLLCLVCGNLALAIFIPPAAPQIPGSARTSRAVFGASPKTLAALPTEKFPMAVAPSPAREARALPSSSHL